MEYELTHLAKTPDVLGSAAGSFKRICSSTDYHADRDVLSCSMLKPMLISPGHYIDSLVSFKRTDAMDKGTLLHALVLEPHTSPEVMAVYPGSLKTPDGKAFVAANPDRICISLADLLLLKVAAEKTRYSLFRGRPFFKFIEEGEVEPAIYFTDPTTGLKCRTRPDLNHPDFIFDLKSSRHASAMIFQQDAVSMHYDMQAFMYSMARCLFEGTTIPKPFVFVKVESSAPNSVHFMPSKQAFLENGFDKYAAAMGAIKACTDADLWPTLQGEVDMDLLPWQAFKSTSTSWSNPALPA